METTKVFNCAFFLLASFFCVSGSLLFTGGRWFRPSTFPPQAFSSVIFFLFFFLVCTPSVLVLFFFTCPPIQISSPLSSRVVPSSFIILQGWNESLFI